MQTHQEINTALANRELFTSLDAHFACFMAGLAKAHPLHVSLASALVSKKTDQGNVCLDLAEYAEKPLHPNLLEIHVPQILCPPLSEWADCLLKSGVVAEGTGNTPLVLDRKNRLYLRRYWEYEHFIIRYIQERGNSVMEIRNIPRLVRDVASLFPPSSPNRIDWQKIAAMAAVIRSFSVISGGPGTGKTSTVAKILAILLNQSEEPEKLRILLGAPTGKAASRLQESLISADLLQGLPEKTLKAVTLHRMLGSIPSSPYFRYNEENHLPADIIVIDEASMVDLPLMAKLMQAVPHDARLILLGDRHQLASVQPGSVLGDICHSRMMKIFSQPFWDYISKFTGDSPDPALRNYTTGNSISLQDSFIELDKSYRFASESSIARLAAAVKEGHADAAFDLILSGDDNEVIWSELPPSSEIETRLLSWPGSKHYELLQHSSDPDACFDALKRFRILCSLRNGPFGTERINTILTRQIARHFSRKPSGLQSHVFPPSPTLWPGQPLMITRNDYNLQLFNGDVGIVLPDLLRLGVLRFFFRKDSGAIHDISPAMLPAHETAFAMTVHKSQGSEFDRVLLILPEHDSPLLTRELLYTAITRARYTVEIWGKKEIFLSAVRRRIKRTSGVSDALWG